MSITFKVLTELENRGLLTPIYSLQNNGCELKIYSHDTSITSVVSQYDRGVTLETIDHVGDWNKIVSKLNETRLIAKIAGEKWKDYIENFPKEIELENYLVECRCILSDYVFKKKSLNPSIRWLEFYDGRFIAIELRFKVLNKSC